MPDSEWKDALDRAPSDRASGFDSNAQPGAGRTRPLALQFEIREQTPRTIDRWRGPTARRADGSSGAATYRLGVRPVIRSTAGKWTRQGLTWTTLPHQVNRLELDPTQHRWFLQFLALHRATRVAYVGQDADWVYLDEFTSPLLWPLLAEAVACGIALVGPKDAEVRVGRLATLGLDLASDDGGGIRVSSVFEIDGDSHDAEHAGATADHGLYSFSLDAGAPIFLAPTASPLTADQKRLVGQPAVIRIPADDVEEFERGYYPRLRRGVELTSADGSVELPEPPPPVLVLTAGFAPKHRLTLAWTWEYDSAGPLRRVPLEPGARNRDRVPADSDRDPEAEEATLALVRNIPGVTLRDTTLTELDAAEFSANTIPLLEQIDNVRVEISGERPDYRELVETPQLTIRTMETDRRDWFDLSVLVTVDGHEIPFGPLFKALATGRTRILLVDNTYLSLKQPVFDSLRELIDESDALTEWETGPRISRYQASLWADFEDLADQTQEAIGWRETAKGLMDATVEPTDVPAGLAAQLRPYQKDGFDWLTFLWRHELGGILADDMGLGKTVQTLALIAHARESKPSGRPFLVVAPTSVVSNWASEAARFTPGLGVRIITETEKKAATPIATVALGVDIIVTSYALLRLDFDSYRAIDWAGAIFDEAQFLKNPASRIHECARDLPVPFRLALTGTPLENSLLDLWALFAITAPGLFPSIRKFTEQYVRPVGRGSSAQARRRAGTVGVSGERADVSADTYSRALILRLRRRIRPLMMRRTKDLVAPELPDKQEQELRIELGERHRALYDTMLQRERRKVFGLIDDFDKNRFIVFRSITLLRLLALDAALVDDAYADIPSSKLEALDEQLQDVVAEGHRALVFSQFTGFLKQAAARLDASGIEYVYLDGSSTRRPEIIDSFKSGQAPVFLISLKAGGFGLNLTEADYVFLLDPWWNPAAESQAIDRTHRIGQTRNVMVYRIIASGTIEEKVMALKAQKAALFDAVMDDDAMFSSTLTADDIRGLFDE